MKFKSYITPNACDGCCIEFYGNGFKFDTNLKLCKVCSEIYNMIKIPKHIPHQQKQKFRDTKLRQLCKTYYFKFEDREVRSKPVKFGKRVIYPKLIQRRVLHKYEK